LWPERNPFRFKGKGVVIPPAVIAYLDDAYVE
jgi:hypothetical protein